MQKKLLFRGFRAKGEIPWEHQPYRVTLTTRAVTHGEQQFDV